MKIIVDAMGGDNAPRAAVLGGVRAAKEFGVEILFVGREGEIRPLLAEAGAAENPAISVVHTDSVIDTGEHPTAIMKAYRDCSMAKALDLLHAGEGDAVVSAGNTGALLTGATLIAKRIRGVRRAALAPIIPTPAGGAVLCDSGANAECTAEYLQQFAILASFYAESVLGRKKPETVLLNIGAEETKGTPMHVEAYEMLKKADSEGLLSFSGNIEGRDVMSTTASVIVADGFSGNVLLKTTEGVALYFAGEIKKIFKANFVSKIAALLVMKGINNLKKSMDYKEVGGAPLLGITKPVIKAHGSANDYAFRSAIRQAMEYAASDAISRTAEGIAALKSEA
ncbi:MAG: phosphate acyltransferase PlsX [Clostridia bacterium]|nr:phosphate acyltransferase PlsX [Clostridia bacterium]